jgi:hypothetical protein
LNSKYDFPYLSHALGTIAMAESNPVSNTIGALQTAYGTLKGIADLNEVHAIKAQIGELQAQILAAQESALRSQEREATLARRVDELERQIAEMKKWEAEKSRYELHHFETGALAYVLKESECSGAEPHYICINCFEEGHASILQKETRQPYFTEFLTCNRCGAEIIVQGMRRPEHSKGARRPR